MGCGVVMPSGTGYTPDKPTTTGYSSSLIIFRIASRKSSLLGKSRSRIIFNLFFSIFISLFVVVVVIVNNDGELAVESYRGMHTYMKLHYKMSTSCLALVLLQIERDGDIYYILNSHGE